MDAADRARKVRKLTILSGQLTRMVGNCRFYSLPFWKRSRLLRRIRRLESSLSGTPSHVPLRLVLAGAAALALAACPPDTPPAIADNPSFDTAVKNPFGFIPAVAERPVAPAFVDINNDGDADLFTGAGGEGAGVISYYKNKGSATSPKFAAAANYPNLPDNASVYTNGNPVPVFAPVRGVTHWDLFIGHEPYDLLYPVPYPEYYENSSGTFGTASSLMADLPSEGSSDGALTVTFVDLNGDKLLDAIVSETDDVGVNTISYYKNTGTKSAPIFTDKHTNLGLIIPAGSLAFPAFVDIDADGDYDAFIGDDQGNMRFFKNNGSSTAPKFAAAKANPYGLTKVPAGPTVPAFVDIDADGDFDLFVGDVNGDLWFFENTNL